MLLGLESSPTWGTWRRMKKRNAGQFLVYVTSSTTSTLQRVKGNRFNKTVKALAGQEECQAVCWRLMITNSCKLWQTQSSPLASQQRNWDNRLSEIRWFTCKVTNRPFSQELVLNWPLCTTSSTSPPLLTSALLIIVKFRKHRQALIYKALTADFHDIQRASDELLFGIDITAGPANWLWSKYFSY